MSASLFSRRSARLLSAGEHALHSTYKFNIDGADHTVNSLNSIDFSYQVSMAQTARQCYWIDGTTVTSTGNDNYIPCYDSGDSHCCAIGEACLTNGLCFSADGGGVYRSGCTDPTFTTDKCKAYCPGGYTLCHDRRQKLYTDCVRYSQALGEDRRMCTTATTQMIGVSGGTATEPFARRRTEET